MFTTIQIILLAIIIFAISRVYLRFREGVLSRQATFFWLFIWIAGLVGVSLPQTTTRIAEFFGVGRGVDIIVYISLAIIFYLVFRIYVMIEDLRSEITFLVRQIALQNSSKKSPRALSSSRPPKAGPPMEEKRESIKK